MRVISAVLSGYMILLIIRILLTWFRSSKMENVTELLGKITDPYLKFFKRFSFLRTERIDFTPIFAIVFLVIILSVTSTIATYGSITLGLILAIVIDAVWSAFSFLLFFFFVITALRLVAVLLNSRSEHPFWTTLDVISQPLVIWVMRILMRKRIVHYRTQLLLTVAALVATFLVCWIIANGLQAVFIALPI